VWDALVDRGLPADGDCGALLAAHVLHAKAHLLLTLGRDVDAMTAANQALNAAGSVVGDEAEDVKAQVMSLQLTALRRLKREDEELAVTLALIDQFSTSEVHRVRVCVGWALRDAIWLYRGRGENVAALDCSHRVVWLFDGETDPERLIETSEIILRSADALHRGPRMRRRTQPIRDQVQAMCDSVQKMAEDVGGAIGSAVALNAICRIDHARAWGGPRLGPGAGRHLVWRQDKLRRWGRGVRGARSSHAGRLGGRRQRALPGAGGVSGSRP
jgi:hypothetical protein